MLANFIPVNNLINNYKNITIRWEDRPDHLILPKVPRTLIDSQQDFEEQIHKLVDFVINTQYEFKPNKKYDFWIKSKNCHFVFKFNKKIDDLYIVTIIPQDATDCVKQFSVD